MTALPKVGRCQHCQQIRPVFRYDAKFDNDEPIWDTPCPEFWIAQGTWLCARDYSAAETARVNGLTFHVEHDLEVWPWKAAKPRLFTPDGEVLTQADEDLKTCEAILALTEEAAS
ncbi:hypothetical protein [Streptomyces sp. NPDC097640]|uniref:hypothetical protein n=1 Tax=Streptomyces sp. NPDC097640 TaxID=3157229 RepID=UPI00332107E0